MSDHQDSGPPPPRPPLLPYPPYFFYNYQHHPPGLPLCPPHWHPPLQYAPAPHWPYALPYPTPPMMSHPSAYPPTDVHFRKDRHWSSQPRSQSPPQRPIIQVSRSLRDSAGCRYPSVTLLCYNLLSQDLLRKNMYLYNESPEEYLSWEERGKGLVCDLLNSKADVLCLQEVDEEYYDSLYLPQLESNGYAGIFKKRTGTHLDGCALFYLVKKLELVDHKKVEFQRGSRTLDRDNVAIVARFRFKSSSSSEFCVATVHILYNPKAGEVKLAQLCLLLAELHKMASVGEVNGKLTPSILCGDLNCLCHSPFIKFITNSSLDYSKMSAVDVAGYRHGYHRTLPVPILHESLSIGQDCQYYEQGVSAACKPDDVIDLTNSPPISSPSLKYQPEHNGGVDLREFPSLLPSLPSPTSSEPAFKHFKHGTTTTTPPPPIHEGRSSSPVIILSPDNVPSPLPPQPPLPTSPPPSVPPPPPSSAFLSHPFHFQSAYPVPSDSHSSPIVTTYHSKACELVDYIFFTPVEDRRGKRRGLHLVSRKALPSTHILHQIGPQPNQFFPSDHLYLQVELQLVG